MGDDSTVITGNVTDKRESKKAAAKTAGWIIGGALSALFTPRRRQPQNLHYGGFDYENAAVGTLQKGYDSRA